MSNPGTVDDEPLGDDVDAPDAEADRIVALETEARRQGWRPQEEYRGPAGQWRSAEDFLKRGQDILPMVRKDLLKERERANNMEKEIAALRVYADEQKAVMEDLLKMARNAGEAGYRRAVEELKAQQRQAAQQGDLATVVALGEKISEVQEERAKAEPAPVAPKVAVPVPKPQIAIDPAVEAFVEENPWFNSDAELHRAMEMEHMLLLRDAPGMALDENLRQAKEAVMARFPKKFGISQRRQEDEDGNPPPRRANGVSPPTPPANSGRQVKTGIASIENVQERQMAQQAFARAKRLMPAITETEWFQIYQDPRADVIEMIDSGKKKGK